MKDKTVPVKPPVNQGAPTAKALQYHPTDRALDRACRVTMPELKGWLIKRSAQLGRFAAAKGLGFFLEIKGRELESNWTHANWMLQKIRRSLTIVN